jgi:2-iminobutanoate/2-iminopropanoate deaminase
MFPNTHAVNVIASTTHWGRATISCFLCVLAGCASTASSPEVRYIPSSRALTSPFSIAVMVGNDLFTSGQIGVPAPDASTPQEGLEIAARHAMDGVQRALRAGGATFDHVYKCNVMLADMKNYDNFNSVYVTYFKPGRLPARSAFGANGLALNAAYEVECWAHIQRR